MVIVIGPVTCGPTIVTVRPPSTSGLSRAASPRPDILLVRSFSPSSAPRLEFRSGSRRTLQLTPHTVLGRAQLGFLLPILETCGTHPVSMASLTHKLTMCGVHRLHTRTHSLTHTPPSDRLCVPWAHIIDSTVAQPQQRRRRTFANSRWLADWPLDPDRVLRCAAFLFPAQMRIFAQITLRLFQPPRSELN